MLVILDGSFQKTYETRLLGNIPQEKKAQANENSNFQY